MGEAKPLPSWEVRPRLHFGVSRAVGCGRRTHRSWGLSHRFSQDYRVKSPRSCLTLCGPMDCGLENGFPFPLPGDLPSPGIEPCLLSLLCWQAGSLPLVIPGRPRIIGDKTRWVTSHTHTHTSPKTHLVFDIYLCVVMIYRCPQKFKENIF